LERKNNEEEKGILQSRNQELQQELEALKVIVALIHQVSSSIRSYCFLACQRISVRMWTEYVWLRTGKLGSLLLLRV
jgi:hypothetical protein